MRVPCWAGHYLPSHLCYVRWAGWRLWGAWQGICSHHGVEDKFAVIHNEGFPAQRQQYQNDRQHQELIRHYLHEPKMRARQQQVCGQQHQDSVCVHTASHYMRYTGRTGSLPKCQVQASCLQVRDQLSGQICQLLLFLQPLDGALNGELQR